MQNQARIVIVGGGIMGAGLLYHLAEEGCTDVLLIEKGELTSGSTWHAAGQCPSFTGSYALAQLHAYSNKLYPRLEELTGQYTSWHASGGIRLALSQQDLDWFQYVRGFADNVGFSMEIIGVEEIRKLNPFLDTSGVLAGAWTTDDGHGDPAGICNAMARGASDMGATIVRNNRVVDINQLASGEWELQTEQGTIRAEIVVNAAGCYARQVAQMVGTDLPITNMEHQYLVTETIQEFVDRDEEIPVIRDSYAAGYIRQEQNSGLIGLYEQREVAEAWTGRGFPQWESDSELFGESVDRLMPWLERAMERMPVFADAGIKRWVNGAIAHTPDGGPLLGPVAGLRNFWNCCGSSFGIAQGAGCGKYLAQWMLYGDAEINMTSLDSRRFGPFADEAYMRAKGFQDYRQTFVTPLPDEELPAGRPKRTSVLYETLCKKGAEHSETFGWERPKWFSADGRREDHSFRRNNVFEVVAEECLAVRNRVGLMELSGFAKFELHGPAARSFLDRVCANRLPARDGGIVLTHLLSEAGRIAAEFTVTQLSGEHFYVLSALASELRDLDLLMQRQAPQEEFSIQNVTDTRGVLVLAGPRSRDLLSKLTDTNLGNDNFPWLSCQEIRVAGIPVRALRVNYVGELGWELHPTMDSLCELYEALWQAGTTFDIADFGLYALNSLRMEKAYRGYGSELTNEVTLLDADMARFIKFDKGDFMGRDASLRQQQQGRSQQLVYFEIATGDSDVRGGEPVYHADRCIGVTTSGAYGHSVQQSLGFAYVELAYANAGTSFDVELLGERYPATVLPQPAYDPASTRSKA